jgi:hypothetical protein
MVTSVGSSHFDEKMPNEYVEALYVAFSGTDCVLVEFWAEAAMQAIANTHAVKDAFIFPHPSLLS